MARLSSIPFEKVGPELQAVMREYDLELGGSGFVQVPAHAPEGAVFRQRGLRAETVSATAISPSSRT